MQIKLQSIVPSAHICILIRKIENTDLLSQLIVNTLHGNIVFQNVVFEYPSRKENRVLKDVSFSVEPGHQVAVAGPSGAGKSTLVSLLLKFYEPTGGKIFFDERDSSSIPITALRQQMAIVPQDVFLFGGSIRENIARVQARLCLVCKYNAAIS